MAALSVPYSDGWIKRLDFAMVTVEGYGGTAAISRIQGYLTQYQDLDTKVNAVLGNAGYKRVDEIEWFAPGAASVGFEAQRAKLRKWIAAALDLGEYLPSGGLLVRS